MLTISPNVCELLACADPRSVWIHTSHSIPAGLSAAVHRFFPACLKCDRAASGETLRFSIKFVETPSALSNVVSMRTRPQEPGDPASSATARLPVCSVRTTQLPFSTR